MNTRRRSWSAELGAALLAALLLVAVGCSSGSHGADAAPDGRGLDAEGDGGAPDAEMTADATADQAATDAAATDGGATDGNTAEAGDATADGSAAHGDAAGDTKGDLGVAPPPCTLCGLYAGYAATGMQDSVTGPAMIRLDYFASIQIFNGSDERIPLAPVTFRYWFTNDGVSWQWQCVSPSCANVVDHGIHPISPRNGADSYEEMGFSGGTLDAFSDTGPIAQDWGATTNGFFLIPTIANDYSYSANPGQPDPRVTIYVGGNLVWGVEP